jgi:hypothetical protein
MKSSALEPSRWRLSTSTLISNLDHTVIIVSQNTTLALPKMKKNVASKRPGVVFLMKSVMEQDIPGLTHKAYSFLMHIVT